MSGEWLSIDWVALVTICLKAFWFSFVGSLASSAVEST